MAEQAAGRIGIVPDVWFLVFATTAKTRWLRWLALGRFKHVLAFGWVPDQRVWLVYEVSLGRTRVAVMPDCPGSDERIALLRAGNVTIAVAPGEERMRWMQGFWCVPAMAHLIGLRSRPWRPDALFKACMRQGGSVVEW